MARKNVVRTQLLSAQSLTTSFISPVTTIKWDDNVSYQINVTTTDSVGSFSVQVSNDYSQVEGAVQNPGNWDTLTLSGVPTVNMANDVIVISLNQLPYFAIRLVYTESTSGTGVCDVWLTAKQIGG